MGYCVRPLSDDAEDFGKKKISCKDVAFAMDNAIEHLEGCDESEFVAPGDLTHAN